MMYKIINISDGSEIGKVENPTYIKIKEATGVRIQLKADEPIENAQGIAYRNSAYNLQGKDGVGSDITVILVKVDAGEAASDNTAAIAANSEAIDQLIVSMLGV